MTADFTPSAAPRSHRRRWRQFSLRTLLLVMIPITCLAAWLGSEYRRGQRQHAIISWVEQQGGSVMYDEAATRANWRRQWFGEWFPESVWVVEFTNRPLTDVTPLANLAELKALHLMGTQVDDVTPLGGLEHLQSLHLYQAPIEDLTPLARLEKLRILDLAHTPVSDLTPLAGLENLESLNLSYSQASDLSPLAGLVNLKVLELKNTPLNDTTPLIGLVNLQQLELEGTQVCDEDIQTLREALPSCTIKPVASVIGGSRSGLPRCRAWGSKRHPSRLTGCAKQQACQSKTCCKIFACSSRTERSTPALMPTFTA